MSLMNHILNKKNEKQYLIMLVDKNSANVQDGKIILQDFYQVITAESPGEMFRLLEEGCAPDLILLDHQQSEGTSNFEALARVRRISPALPVVLLFDKPDAELQRQAFENGAVGYITKPFMGNILLKRIEAHLLVSKQRLNMEAQQRELALFNDSLQGLVQDWTRLLEDEMQRIRELQSAIIGVMAEMVDCRDDVTGGHIERTKRGVGMLLTMLQKRGIYQDHIEGWDVDMVMQASQLHDVGKIYISDSILQKPGRLTDDEFFLMKKHTDYGNTIIDRIESITRPNELTRHAKIFAGFHHEKWDGSGYPLGLAGQDIPLQGRIMAVADVYDALVSERPYKKALSYEQALKIILDGSGSHFDPLLAELFVENSDYLNEFYEASKRDENLMKFVARG